MSKYTTQLVQLAKEKGLKIKITTNHGIMYAGSIQKEGGDYIIRVNRHDKKQRQRYTIAILMSYFELNKDGVDNGLEHKLNYATGFQNQKSLTIQSADMAFDLLVPKSKFDACIKEQFSNGIYDEEIAELAGIFEVPLVLIEKRVIKKP